MRAEPAGSAVRTGPAIDVTGLTKSYGEVSVLAGIDLRVPRGGVFALLGPNGAGKTTIVRILSTLTRADSGRARVAGFDVVRERRQVRRSISLTGQYAAVDELQTGEENLRMMARLSGMSRPAARDRARNLLTLFDLADAAGRKTVTYSGGMRRRLDLAASLVGRPSVIFLDEPTTGLDPRSRQGLWQVIGDLAADGVSILLTTQYLEEADRLADRVGVLDGGRLVAVGTPGELKQKVGGGGRLDLVLVDATAYQQVAGLLGHRVVHAEPEALTLGVATGDDAARIRLLLDEVDPHRRAIGRFAVHDTTLDDVYLALTGSGADRGTGRTEPLKENADV